MQNIKRGYDVVKGTLIKQIKTVYIVTSNNRI